MDPISAIIIGLIWAALRAPREAGRSMRQDYRQRAGRWNSRAEPWMTGRGGRGRGGGRIGGYDRNGRAYRPGDHDGRNARRGDPGWRTDPRAWTGREGRARVARGVRPSAIRSGIVAGALAYTGVFGLGVASRGFARGLRGGYRMGRQHYLGKRNEAQDPSFTVTPGAPDEPPPPDAEVVDAVIVEDPNTKAPTVEDAVDVQPGPAEPKRPESAGREAIAAPADRTPAGWLISVFAPGGSTPVDTLTVTEPGKVDDCLAVIAQTPGLRAEVRELADLPEDSRPQTAAGPTTDPGENMIHDGSRSWSLSPERQEELDEALADAHPDSIGTDRRTTASTNLGGIPVSTNSSYTKVNGNGNDVVSNTVSGNITGGNVQIGGGAQVMNTARPGSIVGVQGGNLRGNSVHIASGPGGTSVTVDGHAPAQGGASAVTVFSGGGGSIAAPLLMEGANYDAHLHNLNVLAKEARAEYSSAELTLASASAARQRAEHAMTAVEQMAAGLAAQDFGETHVGNMSSLHEMLARQVEQSRTAERAAQESLATSEHLIELCVNAAAVFQRDHGQLAEAHAAAPHAAKTREAYQPM